MILFAGLYQNGGGQTILFEDKQAENENENTSSSTNFNFNFFRLHIITVTK